MLKFIIASLALALFAMTFIAVEAQAEFRPCIQSPKNYLPCPMTAERPQLPKSRTR